jgi:hypothetical protein
MFRVRRSEFQAKAPLEHPSKVKNRVKGFDRLMEIGADIHNEVHQSFGR